VTGNIITGGALGAALALMLRSLTVGGTFTFIGGSSYFLKSRTREEEWAMKTKGQARENSLGTSGQDSLGLVELQEEPWSLCKDGREHRDPSHLWPEVGL
jgi:hypothetical protein